MENEYLQYAEREQEAFVAFKETYEKIHEYPQRPTAISASRDIYTYLLIIVTISALLLTSLRTADAFYRSAQGTWLGAWVPWTEAALAILTVEGGIVVYSMARARRVQAEFDARVFGFGLLVLGIISITASLGQSVSFVQQLPVYLSNYLDWALTFVIGPAGALAAYIGGHIIGSVLSDFDRKNVQLNKEYTKEVEAWNKSLIGSWNANKKKILGGMYQATQQPIHTVRTNVQESKKWRRGELVEAITEWFDVNNLDIDQDSVDPAEVADDIGHDNPETVRVKISQMRNK